MLSAFQLENNRLTRLEVEESQPLVNAVWIDLVEPDDDERLRVQSELGQSLATRPELEDIEASARFFEDDDGLHIHSFFFFEDAEDHAGNSTVAFTIRDGRLFTLRERELPAFRLYRMRARSQSMVDGNAYELLLDDLRDYRFYAEDIAHPNKLAVDYIWEYFKRAAHIASKSKDR